MEESGQNKKGLSKKVIAIIVAAIVIVGGSAAAFVLITGSPKAEYFKAEKNTVEFLTEKVQERYQPEFEWVETTMENPTENTVELSGEYNGPPTGGMGMSPEQVINNSTLTMTSQLDQDNKQLATNLQVNFAGVEIKDIKLFMDSDNAFLQLPFLKEVLTIQDSDLSKLLQESDPAFEKTEIDFEALFKQMDGMLSEKDREYLTDEYLMMIFNELPDDAFETKKETVSVQDESVDAEKITFSLTEKQVKELLTTILEKAKDDDQLKEIVEKQMRNQFGMFTSGSLPGDMESEIDTAMEDFEKSIDEAISETKDLQIPDGLTSVIWVKDDLIVKRDFSISMAAKDEKVSTLSVSGDHSLTDSEQNIAYKFTADDSSATIDINLSNKDDSLKDSITIAGGDTELSYNGESTLKDGTREFERLFSFQTPEPNGSGSLKWNGEATYENDQKTAEHTFTLKLPNLPQDFVSLNIKNDAKTIKKVEQPDDSNVKNLGDMSAQELEMYFQTEVAGQFQQWLMKLMGNPGGGNMNSF
ncbi:hypothetical protein GCM10007063_03800 [Lentibacillus kapialis]|uniref:DUF945 family protein n=1 Tax=Lentibacillus kapialis TaxID=340214 RepID=A0A917UTR0_9BACI|nr:DUF6583 family protein [Lentibacillus kapialis]GGJ84504.1 hypothetical protein GCM10007063_03800 [Lentibacillus kapialis]